MNAYFLNGCIFAYIQHYITMPSFEFCPHVNIFFNHAYTQPEILASLIYICLGFVYIAFQIISIS